jgi:Zn-dependent oligopeptidase
MKSETLKQNLNAIRDYISGIKEMKESSEVQLVRSQLRVIEKSIRQFERDGIQVPEGVMGDKLSLEFKIEEIKKRSSRNLFAL